MNCLIATRFFLLYFDLIEELQTIWQGEGHVLEKHNLVLLREMAQQREQQVKIHPSPPLKKRGTITPSKFNFRTPPT